MHYSRGGIETHFGQVVHDQQVEVVEHELLPNFWGSHLLLLLLLLILLVGSSITIVVLMHSYLSIFILSLFL